MLKLTAMVWKRAKPSLAFLNDKIYRILGYEDRWGYDGGVAGPDFISDPRFVHEDSKNEKSHLTLSEEEKEARIRENKRAFNKGEGYFYIINPLLLRGPQKRIIINLKQQQTAKQLLVHIADGWKESSHDWRNHVIRAKIYTMNANRRRVKYDKVVIYCRNENGQQKVLQNILNMVPEEERVEGLSAFYDVVAKGVGTAREIGEGNVSFTSFNTKKLAEWVLSSDPNVLDSIHNGQMDKDTFVREAYAIVLRALELTDKNVPLKF